MAIEFRCTQCNQLLRVPEDAAGKSARCPKCQSLMAVPGAGAGGGVPLQPVGASAGMAPGAAGNPFGGEPMSSPPFGGSPGFGDATNLNPYAAPSAGSFALAQETGPGNRPGLPWEVKGASLATWWETTKLCMMQPSHAFSIMRREGGMGSPMLYTAVGLTIGTVGQWLWVIPVIVFFSMLGGGRPGDVGFLVAVQVGMQIVRGIGFIVLGSTVFLLIGAVVNHVCLMLLKGARQPFDATFRALAYAQGSAAWLNAIPGGGLVALPWAIVMQVIGLAKAHEIETSKALLAVLLPLIVCAGCAIVMIALGFSVAMLQR